MKDSDRPDQISTYRPELLTGPTRTIKSRSTRLCLPSLALLLLSSAGCTSLEFERSGPEHGTFTSTATTFTFLSFDLPGPARDLALGNAADSARPNLLVESDVVVPYLGWFDWIFDIIGVRYAIVTGTWGTLPAETIGADAK